MRALPMDIEECVHTYAPTGQFKCCCDACGNDTKWFMRPDEQACKVRAGNGFKVFMYLHKNMPPPVPSTADSTRFHLSRRLQRYVVPKVYAPADYEEGVLYRQCVLNGLVVVVEVKDDRHSARFSICARYISLSVTKGNQNTRKLRYRHVTCWCRWCSQYSYDQCMKGNAWTAVNLAKAAVPGVEDPEGDRKAALYSTYGVGTLVAILDGGDDDGAALVVYGVLKVAPTRAGQAVRARNILREEWTVKVDILNKMGDEEGGVCFVYNAGTRDVKLPVSALIVPPAGDTRQPRQFLPFQKRTTLETSQGRLELENLLVSRDSSEWIVSLVEL